MLEPRIHTEITDALPMDSKLAFTSIFCDTCDQMLHSLTNENRQAWVETGKGNYCFNHFFEEYSDLSDMGREDELGLGE